MAESQKFLDEAGANQLLSLIFGKISEDITENITVDISNAENNLKSAGAKAVKEFVVKAVEEIDKDKIQIQALTNAEITAIWEDVLNKSKGGV